MKNPDDSMHYPVPATADAPLPAELVDRAKDYMTAARADQTRRAYARAWASFEGWCARHGREALPAGPDTVAGWITALADGADGRTPMARASINQSLCAIGLAHHTARHPFDRKHPIIAETWRGISRTKARTETPRQAQPILPIDLRRILEDLSRVSHRLPADARDAALLALGWAAALRRSELVGLDWERVGSGTGYLCVDERGLIVTLTQSKGSQTERATVVVPLADMPAAHAAVAAWASMAALTPGTPVFRPIDKCQHIASERLADRSVPRIIKARVRAFAIASGKSEVEADALTAAMSGHSLRAGYATAAAGADTPGYRIQQHTRHKSAEMVSRYVRDGELISRHGARDAVAGP